MSMSFDFSDLEKLAADISKVPDNAGPLIRKAVEVTARNVKDTAAQSVKGGASSWKALPDAIDYDLNGQGSNQFSSQLNAEIGYNKAKAAGKLGNLREFGAPGKRLVPHNDLATALAQNQDDFTNGLSKAIADAEKAAGL